MQQTNASCALLRPRPTLPAGVWTISFHRSFAADGAFVDFTLRASLSSSLRHDDHVIRLHAMSMVRRSAARRALALILLSSFSFFGLEGEVADVHDADPGTAHSAAPFGNASASADSSQSSAPTQGQDSHPFHVCHCSHSHGGLVLTAPMVISAVVHACREEFQLPPAPTSLQVSPPVRPPIG
jgi:hypothetical protein